MKDQFDQFVNKSFGIPSLITNLFLYSYLTLSDGLSPTTSITLVLTS